MFALLVHKVELEFPKLTKDNTLFEVAVVLPNPPGLLM